MYISICASTGLSAGYATIKEALDACGIAAVELPLDREMRAAALTSADRFTLDSDRAISAYRDHLEENGTRPAGFLLANNFNADDLDAEIDWVARAVRTADKLGMEALRVDSGMSNDRGITTAQRIERFVECLSKVLDATRDLPTHLGIENHGVGGNSREFLDGVFEGLGSERVGSTMDMGNFYWSGMPLREVYETLEHLAPYTKHTHVKNIRYPEEKREQRRPAGWEYGRYACPIARGDIDLGRVIGFLREAGYRGDLSIEDESLGRFTPEERRRLLVEDAEHLKRLIE